MLELIPLILFHKKCMESSVGNKHADIGAYNKSKYNRLCLVLALSLMNFYSGISEP